MSFATALRSEARKTKRTSLVYLYLIAAAVFPIMIFLFDNASDEGIALLKQDPWNRYIADSGQGLSIAALPLYIILTSTLLPQIEYRNNTWKQVLTSPQPVINVFLSKFLTIQFYVVLCMVAYNLFTLAALLAMHFFKTDLALFAHSMDWNTFLLFNVRTYVALLAISAFQFWLGMRFKNFIVPVGIGFSLWLAAITMIGEFEWPHADKFPFAFSMYMAYPKHQAKFPLMLWSSVGYAVLFLALGFADFKRNKVKG